MLDSRGCSNYTKHSNQDSHEEGNVAIHVLNTT